MTDADPAFVFPDRTLYHGPDEVARDLAASSEGHTLVARELAEEDSLQIGKFRITRWFTLRFSLRTHPPPH